MAFELKPNCGSLFINQRKTQDTHPDMTGEINIDGKLYWLNGWSKITKDGKKWLSVSIKPKQQNKQAHGYTVNNTGTTHTSDDDDLPF